MGTDRSCCLSLNMPFLMIRPGIAGKPGSPFSAMSQATCRVAVWRRLNFVSPEALRKKTPNSELGTAIGNSDPRRNKLLNLAIEIRISKSESRNKSQAGMSKNFKLRRCWTFEIRVFDLFRISCFGFRTSDRVKMVNLFLRGS